MKWSERQISGYLARFHFPKCLMLVPNCLWPGSECDLLAITQNLRVVDIEIKISRADLKADAKKAKWFHNWNWRIDGPYVHNGALRSRQWPHRVWKHYYCLPADIWQPELLSAMSPVSGVLLIRSNKHDDGLQIYVERQAKPDRGAERISAEDAIEIARLASLRMWNAYETLDRYWASQQGKAA